MDYNELYEDHMKLRAQLTLAEKNLKQNVELVNELRGKIRRRDQQLQTNERDMDTLQFNNKRLTKRIEVLQEELNSNAAHQHHSWLLGSGSAEIKRELEQCRESLGVTMEDLQRKIVENQELNEELSEMEVAHNRSVKSLQSQVGKLEQQIVKLNEELRRLKAVAEEGKEESQLDSQIKEITETLSKDWEARLQLADADKESLRIQLTETEQLNRQIAAERESLAAQLNAMQESHKKTLTDGEKLNERLFKAQQELKINEEERYLLKRNTETLQEQLAALKLQPSPAVVLTDTRLTLGVDKQSQVEGLEVINSSRVDYASQTEVAEQQENSSSHSGSSGNIREQSKLAQTKEFYQRQISNHVDAINYLQAQLNAQASIIANLRRNTNTHSSSNTIEGEVEWQREKAVMQAKMQKATERISEIETQLERTEAKYKQQIAELFESFVAVQSQLESHQKQTQ